MRPHLSAVYLLRIVSEHFAAVLSVALFVAVVVTSAEKRDYEQVF
jgi:hypothetical protein